MKQFGSFGLDTSNQCLWRNGTQLSLPPKPFAVLRYLVENSGRLITHDELLDALWPETYVQPQVLRTYMLELRKALGDDAGHPQYIQTLPKRGFCFIAAVTESAEAPRLRGSEAAHEAIPVQPEPAQPSCVGRDEELACLLKDAARMAEGQRRVVFVSGEAGIGKTALAEEFCRKAGTSIAGTGPNTGHKTESADVQRLSPTVACGQCVQGFGGKEEYYPVMEALDQLCASPEGERVCAVLARMAPAWLASLGRGCDAPSTHSARSSLMERTTGDLCMALEALSAEKPLILVLEDMQWADDASLQLLSALARRRAAAKLMVLATFRPHDAEMERPAQSVHSIKGLKQDLLMRRLCTEIALAPLPRKAVADLLRAQMQQSALPPGLAEFVHRHSEGNPLFVVTILEHLIAQQFLVHEGPADAPWERRSELEEMEAGIPDGLAQLIELEVARLRPEEQRLLEAGSLMSVAFPAWAVAAALEQDADETEEACDELSRRLYFVARAGEDELLDGTRAAFYVFAHGLYREVLYRRQAAPRRARRHIRIAEKLGEVFRGREADVAREMAVHFEAAGAWSRAILALRTAARHAQQRQAIAEAVQLLEQALRVAQNLGGTERADAEREIEGELKADRAAVSQAAKA